MTRLLHRRQVFIISIHWFILLIFPPLHCCSHNRIIFQSFSLRHTFHYEFQTFLIWIDNDHLKSLQKWPLMFLILWPAPSHMMDVLMLRCYQTWHHPSYNKHCGITQGLHHKDVMDSLGNIAKLDIRNKQTNWNVWKIKMAITVEERLHIKLKKDTHYILIICLYKIEFTPYFIYQALTTP